MLTPRKVYYGSKGRIYLFLMVLDDDYINERANTSLKANGSVVIATLALECCIQVAKNFILRFISYDT